MGIIYNEHRSRYYGRFSFGLSLRLLGALRRLWLPGLFFLTLACSFGLSLPSCLLPGLSLRGLFFLAYRSACGLHRSRYCGRFSFGLSLPSRLLPGLSLCLRLPSLLELPLLELTLLVLYYGLLRVLTLLILYYGLLRLLLLLILPLLGLTLIIL